MQENDVFFPKDLYSEHLAVINSINFTHREIDVIACLVCMRGTNKIAALLSIDPRTVRAHIRNIMLKLGCNARDNIIDFIEKSHKLHILRAYYSSLVISLAFEKSLEEISKLKREESSACIVVYWQDQSQKNAVIHHLKDHLAQAGTKAEIREQDLYHNIENVENQGLVILFLLENKDQENIPEELATFNSINLSEQKNYYFSVFEILKRILPNVGLENIFINFNEQYKSMNVSSHNKSLKTYIEKNDNEIIRKAIHVFKDRRWYSASVLLIIGLFFGGFLILKDRNGQTLNLTQLGNIKQESIKKPQIQSALLIPDESALLKRPELIKQIDDKLKGDKGIRTACLVGTVHLIGMGGVGKTTLARYYAKSHTHPLIWEIKAENKETLINSFKDLAYALANIKEQKDELAVIESIKDPIRKERELLNFVKNFLRSYPNWLLIYDNIKDVSDMNFYYPDNSWGNGKVIITTRDGTNTSYIKPDNLIALGKLNEDESLGLFSKIIYNSKSDELEKQQRQKIKEFLAHIPPFPLDISIAAYYIKNSNISFEEYLMRIKEYNSNFEKLQENLTKKVMYYDQTRRGIIISTFKKIIEKNNKFKDVLFFICLLDSQNIPKEILELFFDKIIIDDFMSQLKEHSLITDQMYDEKINLHLFSLHRVVQSIGFQFLLSELSHEDKLKIIRKIIATIELFYANYKKLNIAFLVPHLKKFEDSLKDIKLEKKQEESYQQSILILLGNLNFDFANDYISAKDYYVKANLLQKTTKQLSPITLAILLKNLGYINRRSYFFEESLLYFQESLNFCKNIKNANGLLLAAENLTYMGEVYALINEPKKAEDMLNEALEKISGLDDKTKKEIKSEIYSTLAYLYDVTYINGKMIQKAKEYAQKALKEIGGDKQFYNIKNHDIKELHCGIVDHKIRLGEVYVQLGQYKEAYEQGYREAEYIVENSSNECAHNISKIFIAIDTGEVRLREGHLKLAENLLSKSIAQAEKLVGESLTLIPRIFRAEARIRLGKLDEAYEDCLRVHKIGNKLKSNYFNLLYINSFYHAAIIKYKKNEFKEAIKYFNCFFREMRVFCKAFFDKETYQNYENIRNIFRQVEYNDPEDKVIVNDCFVRSKELFIKIYGISDVFVQDYILKNYL